MKKYLLILALFAGLASTASAQKVVLKQDVARDSIPKKFGPNLRYYLHFFAGYGFIAGPAENDGSKVRYGVSHEWVLGARFKFKVCEVYSIGTDLALTPQVFKLKQDEGKTLPDDIRHDNEKLKFTNLGLTLFNRFNWDKRGNYMGNFIDLGVYGNWLPATAHIYRDKLPEPDLQGAKYVIVRQEELTYTKNFNYGVLARIGFNRYIFYGTYRLSDIFDEDYYRSYADLPRFTFGFQLGLHK